MIKRFLVPLVVAPLLFTALSASSATLFTDITLNPGFTYSPSPANNVLYLDEQLTPQNSTYIQSVLESEFGLDSGSLIYESACEKTVCDDASGFDSNSFTSNDPFNYLAIHFGQGELFFYWANPITSFSIAGYEDIFTKGGGLSNYRAYSDGLSEVPVPAAAWLFGIALLGLMGLRRKM